MTDASSLLPVYHRADVVMARGEGVYLWDEQGRKYLDYAAGIAVNALGHCHPHLVAAITQQAATLWHCSNLYRTAGNEKLAARLTEHSFAEYVFFTNSGAEAVECGIKMVRRYHAAKGTSRPEIITMQGGFHGRTLACISASKNPRAVEGYEPLLEGFAQAPFGDIAALTAMITPRTGGILLETVQGEGGIRVHSPEYLKAVRALCDKHDILLFLDEVQCGMGRTGTLFAFEQAGITPDICAVAKGIGGGFPLGACLSTRKAASGMAQGSHGGTYGGNPLAMAAGNAVMDIITQPDFMEHVQASGVALRGGLTRIAQEYPKICGVIQGQGLMLGMQLHVPARDWVSALREHGLLAVAATADNSVRFVPPLIITQAHIEEALAAITQTCKDWV